MSGEVEKLARRMIEFLSEGDYVKSGMMPWQIDQRELEMGIKEESEHSSDPELCVKIAMDHLAKTKNYYSRLKKAGL